MRGVVGGGAGQDLGAVPHGLDDRGEHGDVFLIAKRRGFPGGAGDDQAVAAVIDKLDGQLRCRIEVDLPVFLEGSHHGGEHRSEGVVLARGMQRSFSHDY